MIYIERFGNVWKLGKDDAKKRVKPYLAIAFPRGPALWKDVLIVVLDQEDLTIAPDVRLVRIDGFKSYDKRTFQLAETPESLQQRTGGTICTTLQ